MLVAWTWPSSRLSFFWCEHGSLPTHRADRHATCRYGSRKTSATFGTRAHGRRTCSTARLCATGWGYVDGALRVCHLCWMGGESWSPMRTVGVPVQVELKVVPLSEQYWERVVKHCIGEMRQGRTPNPDVLCNSRCSAAGRRSAVYSPCAPAAAAPWARWLRLSRSSSSHAKAPRPSSCRVKFGAFFEYLEQHDTSFDRIASGHYARVERVAPAGSLAPEAQLALTPDAVKDQTYFLAHLQQAQLARTMFPLGHLTKAQASRQGRVQPGLAAAASSTRAALSRTAPPAAGSRACRCSQPAKQGAQGQPGHLLPGQGQVQRVCQVG